MSFTTLMYHEIRESRTFTGQPSCIHVRQDYEDNLPPPLFVMLENFQAQMTYLYDNKYHTLTLDEVINYYYKGAVLPEKSVLITFDDCYQSIGLYAYQILKKYQFHAVAFVVTGWLNAQQMPFTPEVSRCLTEGELQKMVDVFEYANHTDRYHTRAGSAMGKLMEAGDREFLADLNRCNSSAIIGAKDVFAYPFGLYCNRNVVLLRNSGYRLAFTSEGGKNNRDIDPLLLKRNVIPYFMKLETFLTIIH